jgi:hypothetical protein
MSASEQAGLCTREMTGPWRPLVSRLGPSSNRVPALSPCQGVGSLRCQAAAAAGTSNVLESALEIGAQVGGNRAKLGMAWS